jgi:hypothetical protein
MEWFARALIIGHGERTWRGQFNIPQFNDDAEIWERVQVGFYTVSFPGWLPFRPINGRMAFRRTSSHGSIGIKLILNLA